MIDQGKLDEIRKAAKAALDTADAPIGYALPRSQAEYRFNEIMSPDVALELVAEVRRLRKMRESFIARLDWLEREIGRRAAVFVGVDPNPSEGTASDEQ